MKTITLDYTVRERKTFTIPQNWQKWFTIWDKEEDDRTESEWKYLESRSLADFLYAVAHIHADEDDIDIWDYE